MPVLAINGGKPVRTELFPAYNTIGDEEKRAVQQVLDSGNLSQFLGAYTPDFLGGPAVRAFEQAWADAFGVSRAISVNSNTSGLFAAMGAIGVGPGDEVIVSPYTMTASAIAPLVYGAVPVFADIDPNTLCLDPKSIEARITPRTKAILVVHIMGHPADMDAILEIARRHKLRVVEDCAQAPMGKYKGRLVGTLGDCGVFSLNYHKHIHTGEGGVITTNDPDLARRIELIRNHGENVVEAMGIAAEAANIVGFNYRMTEIEAAIGTAQLAKLPRLLSQRFDNVAFLNERLQKLPGLIPQAILGDGSVHTFYVHAVKVDTKKLGVSRDRIVAALKAELPSAVLRETTPLIGGGYVRPLYLQPLYQQRASACSFNCPRYSGTVDYRRGLCPVAERMHFEELITHEFMRPGMSRRDLEDVALGFEKVIENVAELRG